MIIDSRLGLRLGSQYGSLKLGYDNTNFLTQQPYTKPAS